MAGSIALLLIVGAVYEFIAARVDARLFPQEGRSVQLGPEFQDIRLNLDCSGPPATGVPAPTVILDSGHGVPAVGWKFVQADVAKFARVCSYDRAGYAWSSTSTTPRTSLQIAKELHALLETAGEKGPFVLVGHSFGGYNIRVYADQYPHDVAGMVLVDASHEDQLSRMPPSMRALLEPPSDSQLQIVSVLRSLGILRALGGDPSEEGLPQDFVRQLNYLQHSQFMATTAAELRSFEQSAAQVRDAGTLGDRPLIVLTAGKYDSALELSMGISQQDIDEQHRIWVDELQASHAQLSTRGKQLIIEDSAHMIPFERPDAVVAAIREVLEAARALHTPQSAQVQSAAGATVMQTSPSADAMYRHSR